MFLCKYFVFIHVVKTGGSFIVRALEKATPKEWNPVIDPGHQGVSAIPASHKKLPIIGMVRNPWDHYVSWYEYCRRTVMLNGDIPENHPFALVSNQGRGDFKSTVMNIMNLPALEKLNIGGATAHHMDMFGMSMSRDSEATKSKRLVGKVENLRTDFVNLLRSTDAPHITKLEKLIEESPRYNVTERKPYREYYDDELKNIVEERDKYIIQKYGYEY